MKIIKTLSLIFFLISSTQIQSQNVDLPQLYPKSMVVQRVGLTYITLEYSSPSTDRKDVFGTYVPYGKLWGAGARENTTIEFTNDVLIEGKKISSGKYGLFMVPNKDSFEIILSKYYRSWSDTYPVDDEIVLRFSVDCKENRYTKWLNYNFIDRQMESCVLALEWGEVSVPFKIEVVNPNEILFESLKAELKGRGKYLWGAYSDAANYLNVLNIHPNQAIEWINKSLELERNGINLQVKASILLNNNGDEKEIKNLLVEAFPITKNPWVLYNIVNILLQINDTKTAIRAGQKLCKDYENHPNVWEFIDKLGDAYLKDENKVLALEFYKKAQSKAPENRHGYLRDKIKKVEN
jgi:tetratricopeptide (TPR) repeat protein